MLFIGLFLVFLLCSHIDLSITDRFIEDLDSSLKSSGEYICDVWKRSPTRQNFIFSLKENVEEDFKKLYHRIDMMFKNDLLVKRIFTFIIIIVENQNEESDESQFKLPDSEIINLISGKFKTSFFASPCEIMNLKGFQIEISKFYRQWDDFKDIFNRIVNFKPLLYKKYYKICILEPDMDAFIMETIKSNIKNKACFSMLLSINGDDRLRNRIYDLYIGKSTRKNFLANKTISFYCDMVIYTSLVEFEQNVLYCKIIKSLIKECKRVFPIKSTTFYSYHKYDGGEKYEFGLFEVILIRTVDKRKYKMFFLRKDFKNCEYFNSEKLEPEKLKLDYTVKAHDKTKEETYTSFETLKKDMGDIKNMIRHGLEYKEKIDKKSTLESGPLYHEKSSIISSPKQNINFSYNAVDGIELNICKIFPENTDLKISKPEFYQKTVDIFTIRNKKRKENKCNVKLMYTKRGIKSIVDRIHTIISSFDNRNIYMVEVLKRNLIKVIQNSHIFNNNDSLKIDFEEFAAKDYIIPGSSIFFIHRGKINNRNSSLELFDNAFSKIRTTFEKNRINLKITMMKHRIIDIPEEMQVEKNKITESLKTNFEYFYDSLEEITVLSHTYHSKLRMVKLSCGDEESKEDIFMVYDYRKSFQTEFRRKLIDQLIQKKYLKSYLSSQFSKEINICINENKKFHIDITNFIECIQKTIHNCKHIISKSDYKQIKETLKSEFDAFYPGYLHETIDTKPLVHIEGRFVRCIMFKKLLDDFRRVNHAILSDIPEDIMSMILQQEDTITREIFIFSENNYISEVFNAINNIFKEFII